MGESGTGAMRATREEVHVLVTGFGPWSTNSVNPSFLIAKAIHERLDLTGDPEIHVHTLSEPVRVSYKTVRTQIPPLLFPPVTHNPPPTFDLILFVGMAGYRAFYSVEACAFRDGYDKIDTDGQTLDGADKTMWRDLYSAPDMLTPCWNTDDVWRRWKNQVMDQDVRVSDDAGRYLCEFIYYTGLVEFWRRGRAAEARVAFLHVPRDHDSQSVERGIKITEALIKALVESEIASGNLKARRIT